MSGRLDADRWARRLRISPAEVRAACQRPHFGQLWADLEDRSPRLRRQFVTANGLKRELRRMRRIVATTRAWENAELHELPRALRAAVA